MELYTFNKTIEERFSEYENILLDCCGNKVEGVWKSYLSPILEESAGWDAEWCIPSKMCKYLGILYPQYVLVSVLNVDFETLKAIIEIKQDIRGCDLPDEVSEVDIVDLIPLLKQDPNLSLPYMDITAMYLDQYRVFYKRLWWPWDEEEDSLEWVSTHLQDRLLLYYEMTSNKILFETGTIINDLIVEGKYKYEDMLELSLFNSDEDPDAVLAYVNLNADLDAIKKKLVFYSKEQERRKLEKGNRAKITHNWKHCMAIKSGSSGEESLEVLKAATLPEGCPLNIESNLNASIKLLFHGNVMLVGPGNHPLSSVGILELGGELTGVIIANRERPVLEDVGYERSSWLQFSLNHANISNIHLKTNHKFAIKVLNNTHLKLDNVKLTGSNLQCGFHLKSGATLIARNCQFENLNVVIRAMSDVNITLENCVFQNNTSLLTCIKNVKVAMINCTVTKCTEAAIVYVNQKNAAEGSIACLKNVPGFNLEGCTFDENKIDVKLIALNVNNNEPTTLD